MGYIEDIRKINALAKELLLHNIVQSQDEAVVKAREMLVKKDSASSGSDYIDLSKNAIPQQEGEKTERREEWKDAMAKNNEYIIAELRKCKSDIDSFANQLSALRSELVQVRARAAQLSKKEEPVQNVQDIQRIRSAPTETATTTATTEEKRDYVNHPRSGNYKPNDVAIEKFFYYGNKR